MGRVSLGAATAASILFVLAGVALASNSHATGGGEFSYGVNQKLSFEVHDNGFPSADSGTANYRNLALTLPSGGYFSYNADVVCADVEPGVVRFGYYIPDTPETQGLAGTPIIWVIKDGGSPGSGNDSAYFVIAAPESCDLDYPPAPESNVFKGNYTVHNG
jgi:hypothetical protein